MSLEALRQQLDSTLLRLPGSADMQSARREAMKAFQSAGFPTRRQEDWRYTDLKPIASGDFRLVPDAPDDDAIAAARSALAAVPATDAVRLVFVDGHAVPELSTVTQLDGLELRTLGTHGWREFERSPHARAPLQRHPLAALNTAFAQQGAWLRVREGRRIDVPVELVFHGSRKPGQAPQPRLVIDMESGAELTLVQSFLDAEDAAGWMNLVTQVSLGPAAKLALYRLQEHSAAYLHTSVLQASVAEEAELTLGHVELGGRLVRNDIDVELKEPGASAALAGLFLASNGQHVDNHTRVDHVAPQTRSSETYRGIIGESGRGVFNGKVIVRQDAQRIDAHQRSDNLLLSDRAEIDTKPELEIYANDVKCSHGATVGELDETQLFYLRCRGIEEEAARGLLTFAFANYLLDELALAEFRSRAAERVGRRLPERERREALL